MELGVVGWKMVDRGFSGACHAYDMTATKATKNWAGSKHTRISSFPNWVLMKSAREEILAGCPTSSWWKTTFETSADPLRLWRASTPLFSSTAVSTTVTPLAANCLHISNPIPLSAPVTTANLKQKINLIRKHTKREGLLQ